MLRCCATCYLLLTVLASAVLLKAFAMVSYFTNSLFMRKSYTIEY